MTESGSYAKQMNKTQPFLSLQETQQTIEQDPLGNFFVGIKSPETRAYLKTMKLEHGLIVNFPYPDKDGPDFKEIDL